MPGQGPPPSSYGTLPKALEEGSAQDITPPSMSWVREDTRQQCCQCIPLRYCAGFHSLLTIIFSACAISLAVSEDARVLAGGFSACTELAVQVLGFTGFFVGIAALLGVMDNKSTWVWLLSGYLLVRGLMRAVILCLDIQELMHCKDLTLDGTVVTSMAGHFNSGLATAALSNVCYKFLVEYACVSIVDILSSLVGSRTTCRWCSNAERPVYGIAFDDSHIVEYLIVQQKAKEEQQGKDS
mmetsp:Transcript_67833/g.126725  ORF Transcript_67833/g.126725 Transcript_67833/m.126725 type:complete len:240 (-) Transcript_67833:31-750(-)